MATAIAVALLFFFGLLYDKMTMTENVVSKRALVFFWWEASLLFPEYRHRLSEWDDHHNGLCITYTLLFCLVRYLWGYLSFQIQEGHCYHSFFITICLFVCLFVRSFKSKWSPNVNLLILNAKLKEGEKKKKVLITNFSLGVLFNRAISLNTLLVDMNLQIKKKKIE